MSVCVTTYNHADYIKDCLEGILMQKTEFPIEILLGEDASTDGTREICLEYAKKYPKQIRLLLHHRENNIKINGNPSGRFNFLNNLYSAKGKYIALCEGDDYWTDSLKLQKQVELMEDNENIGIVHTKYKTLHEANDTYEIHEKQIYDPDFSEYKNYLYTGDMRTLTVMFRAKFLSSIKALVNDGIMDKMIFGDRPTFLTIATQSDVAYLEDITGIYRIFDGLSVTRHRSLKKRYTQLLKHHECLRILCSYLNIDDEEHQKVIDKNERKIKLRLFILNIPLLDKLYEKYHQLFHADGRTESF